MEGVGGLMPDARCSKEQLQIHHSTRVSFKPQRPTPNFYIHLVDGETPAKHAHK